jgi:hypothetical protein
MSGRKDEFRTVSEWFIDRWMDEYSIIREGAVDDMLDYFRGLITREELEAYGKRREKDEEEVCSYVAPPPPDALMPDASPAEPVAEEKAGDCEVRREGAESVAFDLYMAQ